MGQRIRARREHRDLSQEKLGEAVGVSKGTVSQWEAGTINLKSKYLQKLSEALDCSLDWIIQGEGVIQPFSKQLMGVYGSDVDQIRYVPLVSSVQAGKWEEVIPSFSVDMFTDWVPAIHKRTSARSFAMMVEGESMVSTSGRQQSLPPGSKVIVDPDVDPYEGAIVVAARPGVADDEATIKRYSRDGNQFMLIPNNSQYPTLDGKDSRIIGVVRQVVIDL